MAVSQPRIRTRDTQAKPVDSSLEQIQRGVVAVLALLNPVTAILCLFSVFALVRVKWAKWALLGGVLAAGVVSVFGGFRSYFLWVREIKNFFLAHGLTDAQGFTTFAASHLVQWVLAQLPLAIPLAVIVGACVGLWRSRYAPTWREEKTDKPRNAKEEKSFQKDLAKTQKKMGLWANEKPVTGIDDLAVRVGTVESTLKPFDIPLSALRLHSFIVGPSGFGKTTTILELIKGLVLAPAAQPFRIGTVFITMKPEDDITEDLKAIARRSGRAFHVVTHDGIGASTTYNPLRHGTASERRNILMRAEENAENGGFSEPHYQRSGSRFTLLAIQALEVAVREGMTYVQAREQRPWKMDLEHVAKMMRLGALKAVADASKDKTIADKITRYLAEIEEDPSTASGVGGMRSRFAVIAEGAAGNVLVEKDKGLDLRQAIREGDIVVFNLNAARDLEASQYVANLAISDYIAAMADLGAQKWHKNAASEQDRLSYLLVDEFSALGGSGLVDVLERTRSYGGAALLSAQTYSALDEIDNGFKDRLMTNTTVKLFHQVDVQADELADMLGTRSAMKETFQTFEDKDLLGTQTRASGQGSVREVEVFNLHPNTLRNLNPGEIVGVIKSPRLVEKVKVRKTGISGEEVQNESVQQVEHFPAPAVVPVVVEPVEEVQQEAPAAPAADPWAQVLAQPVKEKKPAQEPKAVSAEVRHDEAFTEDSEDDSMDFPY